MEPGRQRAGAWLAGLADCDRARREADRDAQEPAQLGAGAEIAARDSRGCQPEPIAAQEGSGAARACACACPAPAERAMLDEIIALPDIEEQDGENVAMWVANALDALREERDEARAEVELWQLASGLCVPAEESGGDPGGVRPHHLAAEMERSAAVLAECVALLVRASNAVADLLVDPAWVILHNHGWHELKAWRPEANALLARLREGK